MTISAAPQQDAAPQPEITFAVRGQVGFVLLNRPQALNALTLDMVREMDRQLVAWATDERVQAVVVQGAGNRAFCAGGDVKAVALATRAADPATAALPRDFFREEYTLNHRIFSYPKPYIALVDGIVMGGGVGVSVHGAFRVVSENVTLAMPETMIGFFPDVGGGYFLPRCPGQTGVYMGLTGHRLAAIDAVYVGFATHFVAQENHADLIEALVGAELSDATDVKKAVAEIIDRFAGNVTGESHLAPNRTRIDSCFGFDSMEEIIEALAHDDSDFARQALDSLYAVSPTSLKVTLRQLREGEALHFAKVMTMEYRLSQAFMQGHDFFEGIRAALIDKDRQPKWRPAQLSDVSPAIVDAYFAPRPQGELEF